MRRRYGSEGGGCLFRGGRDVFFLIIIAVWGERFQRGGENYCVGTAGIWYKREVKTVTKLILGGEGGDWNGAG